MGDEVLYEKDGHVVTITYNRPERLNAINGAMREGLNEAWLAFRDDEDAWVAILTGSGRAFCAGADIKDGGGAAGTFAGTFWEKPTINSFESGLELFKPTIAAINGPCLGYGVTAVSFCDWVIASDQAVFGFPEVRIGVPTIVGAIRMPQRLSWADAMELLLVGENVDAERAREMGLVWRVVPHDNAHGRGEEPGRSGLPVGAARRAGDQGGRRQGTRHGLDRGRPVRRDHATRGRSHRRRQGGNGSGSRAAGTRVERPVTSSIRTTTVGSWPIPFGQRPQLKCYYAGELSDDEAEPALVAAARIAMDEQLACGLDQIMGGEVFAPDFVHHVAPRLAGLRTLQRRDPSKGYDGIGVYEIEGDLSAPMGTGHALAFRRERAIEPRLDKAAVPSPWTMTISFDRDRRVVEQLPNISAFVAAEVADMIAAGAQEVQLDAPTEALAVAEARRPVDELAEWMVAPFDGVPDHVRRTVHFCLGDISRQPATQEQNLHSLIPLVRAVEGEVDRIHLECSYAGQWADRGLLAEIPDSIEIIAGIADVKSAPQSTGELSAEIDALLEVVPEDRLLVSSSCGCGRVPHDEAIRLMRNLVKAAHGE